MDKIQGFVASAIPERHSDMYITVYKAAVLHSLDRDNGSVCRNFWELPMDSCSAVTEL